MRRRLLIGTAILIAAGAIGPAAAQLLTGIIDARLAFLVSGGTGAGNYHGPRGHSGR